MDKALEALHIAAAAIRQMAGVRDVSVDNDADSGEIYFAVGEVDYKLLARVGEHLFAEPQSLTLTNFSK